MFHHTSKIFEKIKKIRYSRKKEIFSRASFAKEIIDKLGIKRFNLDYISRECSISKFFLIKCFKQIYGRTPYEYYVSKKVERAKHFLNKDGLSISEISSFIELLVSQSFLNSILKQILRLILNRLLRLEFRTVFFKKCEKAFT
jgi:AraC-like DNA-binding protein